MCAYLHTRQGRRGFERILKGNLRKKALVGAVTSPPLATEVVTVSGDGEAESGDIELGGDAEVVTSPDAVTVQEIEADGVVTLQNVSETRQQRYRRLNRERINDRERDRRNCT